MVVRASVQDRRNKGTVGSFARATGLLACGISLSGCLCWFAPCEPSYCWQEADVVVPAAVQAVFDPYPAELILRSKDGTEMLGLVCSAADVDFTAHWETQIDDEESIVLGAWLAPVPADEVIEFPCGPLRRSDQFYVDRERLEGTPYVQGMYDVEDCDAFVAVVLESP
jgi:hypothetical protein